MPQVTVQIGGRDYKMACGEGEEGHLLSLAQAVDDRHVQLKKQFGEVGDIRLAVMTAIMMADELKEAESREADLRAEIAALRAADQNAVEAFDARHTDVAEQIANAAKRVERLAEELAEGTRRE